MFLGSLGKSLVFTSSTQAVYMSAMFGIGSLNVINRYELQTLAEFSWSEWQVFNRKCTCIVIHFADRYQNIFLLCDGSYWVQRDSHRIFQYSRQLTIKFGLLEHLDLADVHIMEWVDWLTWFFNVFTNTVWNSRDTK